MAMEPQLPLHGPPFARGGPVSRGWAARGGPPLRAVHVGDDLGDRVLGDEGAADARAVVGQRLTAPSGGGPRRRERALGLRFGEAEQGQQEQRDEPEQFVRAGLMPPVARGMPEAPRDQPRDRGLPAGGSEAVVERPLVQRYVVQHAPPETEAAGPLPGCLRPAVVRELQQGP